MRARYTVAAPLGRGMRVFRGVAELADGRTRDVAIMRVVPDMTTNPQLGAMSRAELRSSLASKHPNIVEVVDLARTPEAAYFVVTEHVDGCDLATLVARRKRIPIRDVLHISIECCKGLAYAPLDVTHRDVSPRAILLGIKGEVKLAAVGLAKLIALRERTDPGVVKGKFGYLSPEAASGKEVDHRADVFAAGIVLWELLAGRRLFLGPTDYQTVELVREARVPAIEDLDPALDAIARKALARDAAARFQGAGELGDALAQYARARDIALGPGETASLVRDVEREVDHERSAQAIDRVSLARIQAEVSRMISILEDDPDEPRAGD